LKNTKQWSGLLACLMALSLILAACGNDTNEPDDAQAPSQAAEGPGDPLGAYDPPINVDVVRYIGEEVKFPPGQDIHSNVWASLYEEMGIKVNYKWIVTGSEQYESKLNIAIASNDLPQLMQVNETQLRQLADAGQLADLTAAYDNYASDDLKQVMSLEPGALKSATFDGSCWRSRRRSRSSAARRRCSGCAPTGWSSCSWSRRRRWRMWLRSHKPLPRPIWAAAAPTGWRSTRISAAAPRRSDFSTAMAAIRASGSATATAASSTAASSRR